MPSDHKIYRFNKTSQEKGVSLLEIIVVVGLIGIVAAISFPNIQDWLAKRRLQSEYQSMTAKIDYLRLKARTVAGSARLNCSNNNLTTTLYSASNALLESDPPTGSNRTSFLQYPTKVLITPCPATTYFVKDGSNSGTRGFYLTYIGDPSNRYGSYWLTLSGSTGFVRKYRLPPGGTQWLETE